MCYIAYNKWHETELERWLSDHNVPYPTPADRKDLENLVKNNWQTKLTTPYSDWEPSQLQSYLKSKGQDVQKGAESNKEALVSRVKSVWTDTTDSVAESSKSVKDWIFDGSSNHSKQYEDVMLTYTTQLDYFSVEGIPRQARNSCPSTT